MTIAQHFLGKNINKQQQEPLVPNEKIPTPTIKDVEEGKPVVVTMHTHVRRVSSMTTVCVFITALLVCATGIIGGIYLYRQFSHYKLRHYHGWCSIPYNSDKQISPKAESLKGSISAPVTEPWEMVNSPRTSFFQEEVDIDVKLEQYEKIDVPKFEHGRKAHFIHDFTSNKTAIADYENRRCFVMFLNERFVFPPRALFNLITRMRAGLSADIDTQVVKQHMRVITPRIHDVKNIGVFIAKDCNSMPVFMLERSTSPVYKRSLDSHPDGEGFVGFFGNQIMEYHIENMASAVSDDQS